MRITLTTWRRWLKKGKVKLVQYGGIHGGKVYPAVYEIDGKLYKNANDIAPTYYFYLEPATEDDIYDMG